VSRGAKKASAVVQCPMACRLEIEVMPLRGSPRVLTRDHFEIRPGKPVTLSLPIPAKNRRMAVKSGGVRIQITYNIKRAGAPSITETRRALL
jgi:hypothetical protein